MDIKNTYDVEVMPIPTLKDLLTNPPEYTVYEPRHRDPKTPRKSYKHSIYPLLALPELIQVLRHLPDSYDYEEKYSIRYLVTEEMEILLALEGSPSRVIPAHEEIRSQCIAAGNFFFTQKYDAIYKINHQSGDFRPQASCLCWPIAILTFCNTFPLTNDLCIDINHNSERQEEISVDKNQLLSLLPQALLQHRNAILAANSNRVVEVKANRSQAAFFPTGTVVRSLSFCNDDDDDDDANYPLPALIY